MGGFFLCDRGVGPGVSPSEKVAAFSLAFPSDPERSPAEGAVAFFGPVMGVGGFDAQIPTFLEFLIYRFSRPRQLQKLLWRTFIPASLPPLRPLRSLRESFPIRSGAPPRRGRGGVDLVMGLGRFDAQIPTFLEYFCSTASSRPQQLRRNSSGAPSFPSPSPLAPSAIPADSSPSGPATFCSGPTGFSDSPKVA